MGLHHLNSPLKIRGQALPPGSAGVMIFLLYIKSENPTSRLCAFVAKNSHKGTKAQSKTLDTGIY